MPATSPSSVFSKIIYNLPEPIIISGHETPDPDSMSSAVAILIALREEGMEAFIAVTGLLLDSVSSMITADDIAPKEAYARAQSLIVVDTHGLNRTGLPEDLLARIEHVVVIDHHSLPTDILRSSLFTPLSSVHTTNIPSIFYAFYAPNRHLFYSPTAVATALMLAWLLEQPPLQLVAGIHSDSSMFSRQPLLAAAATTHILDCHRKFGDVCAVDEVDKEAESYIAGTQPLCSHSDLSAVLDASVTRMTTNLGVLMVAVVDDIRNFNAALTFFKHHADFLVFINKRSGRVSARGKLSNELTAQSLAVKFGGGGHELAGGFRIRDGSRNEGLDSSRDIQAVFGAVINAKGLEILSTTVLS